MIERVHIQGFQSLADVDLELGGFTVIQGKSNSGKSAFIRALRAVVTNAGNVALTNKATAPNPALFRLRAGFPTRLHSRTVSQDLSLDRVHPRRPAWNLRAMSTIIRTASCPLKRRLSAIPPPARRRVRYWRQ